MTDKQRLWLKVALFVTLPIWLLPAALGGMLAMAGWLMWLMWQAVSGIVDGVPAEADEYWDGP